MESGMEAGPGTASASGSTKHPQGKWGSACAVCSAAKAKCLRSDPAPDAPCDRCRRLAKECTDQVHLPRKKRTNKTTRTAHLEERLNSLVDLLRASGEIPTEADTQRQPSSQADERPGTEKADIATASASALASQGPTPASSGDDGRILDIPSRWNSRCPPRCLCRATHGRVVLRKRPDSEVLDMYRAQLMPVFPFVVIPPGMRADQLNAEKPILFEAITMAASIYDIKTMRGHMYQLVQHIADEILIASAKSMDMLQALLVMLAWHQNHCVMHAQMNNLLHLAQSQMSEMLLHTEPGVHERTGLMVLNIHEPPPRTNEEKRVALGVWFLSSSISCTLERVLPIKFSRHFRKCLADLEANPEYDSDLLLVHLVKAQHLTQQISDWASREEEEDGAIQGIQQAPASAYLSAFDGEIQRLRNTLPLSLKNHGLLRIHLASASLRLHQPPPIRLDVLRSLAESSPIFSPGSTSTLDVFYSAHSALQDFFDSFFSLPTTSYPAMPVYTLLDVLWSIPILARWAKIMGPGRARPVHAPPDILTAPKVLWDPSGRGPNQGSMHSFGAGMAPVPSFESPKASTALDAQGRSLSPKPNLPDIGSGPREPSIAAWKGSNAFAAQFAGVPPPITDHSQLPASDINDATDANLPRVIVSLRDKLYSQFGLSLDIIGILSKLAQQCEQAHEELIEASPDGSLQSDVWFLFSKKVCIARAKLEKWADIVAAGDGGGGVTEQAKAGSKANSGDADVQMEDLSTHVSAQAAASNLAQPIPLLQDNGLTAFQREIEDAGQSLSMSEDMYDPFMQGNVWTDDMFVSLDPSLWLNDTGNWPTQNSLDIF